MKKLYGFFFAFVLLVMDCGFLSGQSQSDALVKALAEAQALPLEDSVRILGIVVDAGDTTAIPGAHVRLYTGNDSIVMVTNSQGAFLFPKVPQGPTRLNISFIGYSSYSMEFVAEGVQMDFGRVALTQGAYELGAAMVVGHIEMMTARGDTIVYNPAAFKTMEGDYAVDLIVKFPGIEVGEDGTITAHGETVKWALVDGKLMFGRDVMNTIENVKANDIEEVKVYDIADPDKPGAEIMREKEDMQRVMDFTTKSKFTGVLNAQVMGGVGKDLSDETEMTPSSRYKVEGNFGLFNEKRIVTFNGMFNNTRDGSSEIRRRFIGGGRGSGYVGGGDGYGRRNHLNFLISNSNPFTDRNKWQGELSYSFSNTYDYSDVLTERTGLVDSTFLRTRRDSRNESDNHNFRIGIHKRWDNMSLNIDPNISFGRNSSKSRNDSWLARYDEFVRSDISSDKSDGNSFSTSGNVRLYKAFILPEPLVDSTLLEEVETPRRRRPISLNLSAGWSYSKSTTDGLEDYTLVRVNSPDSVALLVIDNSRRANGANADLSVNGVEITPWLTLRTHYSFDHSYSKILDLQTDEITGEISEGRSQTLTHNTIRNSVGTHLSFGNRDSKVSAHLGLNYNATNNMRDEEFPDDRYDRRLYKSLTPSFSIGNSQRHMNATRRYQWNVGYHTSSSNPSLEQLRNYIDVSRPMSPVQGNPNLRQSYNHNLSASLRISNVDDATSINIGLSAGYTRNTITTQRTYIAEDTEIMGELIEEGAELTTYKNVSGAKTASANVSISRPFIGNKFVLNAATRYSYSYRPSYETQTVSAIPGGAPQRQSMLIWNTGHTPSLNVGLRSNHSAVIEYGITSNTALGYTFTTGTNNIRSVRESLGANFRLRFLRDFTLEGDYAFSYYVNRVGSRKGEPDKTQLLNGSLAWDFAKRAGSVKFTVYDILNRNSSFTSSVGSQFITDTWRQLMSRYCMLTVSFRFNKTYGGEGGGQSMRRMGQGPGEGGPREGNFGPARGPRQGGPGGGPRGGMR